MSHRRKQKDEKKALKKVWERDKEIKLYESMPNPKVVITKEKKTGAGTMLLTLAMLEEQRRKDEWSKKKSVHLSESTELLV